MAVKKAAFQPYVADLIRKISLIAADAGHPMPYAVTRYIHRSTTPWQVNRRREDREESAFKIISGMCPGGVPACRFCGGTRGLRLVHVDPPHAAVDVVNISEDELESRCRDRIYVAMCSICIDEARPRHGGRPRRARCAPPRDKLAREYEQFLIDVKSKQLPSWRKKQIDRLR